MAEKKKKSMLNLGVLGLIGLAVGLIVGFILLGLGGKETPWIGTTLTYINTVGQIFLRLLKMIVVPLVFCCITNAIIKLRDVKLLRSLGV